MSDEVDKAPMTIKAVPVETRRKMAACAAKQGLTMAEWLVRAVDNQANLEAGDRVILPGQPDKPEPQVPALPPVSVTELAGLMQAVAAVGTATGLPPGIVREAYAAARMRLREARGLPGKPVKQTRPAFGQTINGDGSGLPDSG